MSLGFRLHLAYIPLGFRSLGVHSTWPSGAWFLFAWSSGAWSSFAAPMMVGVVTLTFDGTSQTVVEF